MFKAVIFDIHGTLVRQKTNELENFTKKKIFLNAFLKIKSKYKIKASPQEIMGLFKDSIDNVHKIKESKGIENPEVKIQNIWGMVLRKTGDEKITKHLLFKIAYDYHLATAKRTMYPYVGYTLKRLKERNFKLGIVSNAQFYTADDLFKLLKKEIKIRSLYKIFDRRFMFYSYKVGYSKPNPDIFVLLRKRLKNKGISKEEVLYVGNDALKDIKTAKKAGLKTCLFVNPETVYNANAKPDYKIRNMRDLIKIVSTER